MKLHTIRRIIHLLTAFHIASSNDCQSKNYGNGGTVCVCNATYCDFIPPIEKVDPPKCLIYTSNKAGLRFSKSETSFSTIKVNLFNTLYVDQSRTYQTIIGFGGAFTDATGINVKSLSEGAQENFMKSYFGPNSIDYNMIRIPIGASDYSDRLYTYDDSPTEDPKLVNFKLAPEDFQYKIPYLQKALQLSNNNIKLLGSAWTCPKWMKWIQEYVTMFGTLRQDMLQPWANYHIKFLDAYKENNLEFWGITTGNEPTIGFAPIALPSVAFTADSLSQWIAYHLGPAVRASNYSNIKIITFDDERLFLPLFINAMFLNPITRQYVDGIGVHWYFDAVTPPLVLDITHTEYPDKFLIGTEAARGVLPWEHNVILGSWQRGEDYVSGIIENLRHWFVGWFDWNLALNLKGGPNVQGNFVDAAVIVNATADEFYKQPMFYAMGHFSKFITPGSVRIRITQFDLSVPTVAFRRTDGATVINILNTKNINMDVVIVDWTKGQINLHLSSRSFTSILYW